MDAHRTVPPPIGSPTRFAKRVGGIGGLAVLDQCFFSGANFLTAVLVGRFAGPEQLGVYSLAISVVMLLLAFQRSLFVLPYIVIRDEIPVDSASGMRSTILIGTLVLCVAASASALLVYVIVGVHFAAILAFAIPAGLCRDFARRLSIAESGLSFALLIDVVVCVLQIGGLVFLATVESGLRSAESALAWCSAVWVSVGFVALLFCRGWFTTKQISVRENMALLIPIGRWVSIAQVVSTAQAFVMPWILAIGHSLELAGVYAACWTLVQVVAPAIEGLGNVLEPAFARSAAKKDWRQLLGRVRTASLVYGVVMAGLVVGAFFGGSFFLRSFYGTEYSGYVSVLLTLTLAAAISNLSIPCSKALIQLRRPHWNVVVSVISMVVVCGVSFLLLAKLGPTGAAWGLVIGAGFASASRWGLLMRRGAEVLSESGLSPGDEQVALTPQGPLS